MPTLIKSPVFIQAAGNKLKIIEEFIGHASSKTIAVSVARMKSPGGWSEPGQTPEFDEYTIVLHGVLCVAAEMEVFEVLEGQAIIVYRGEWVQYSTPKPEGAEYISICVPAFSRQTVHRDMK